MAAPVIAHDTVFQARYWEENLSLSVEKIQFQGRSGGPEMGVLDDRTDYPYREISQLDLWKRIRKRTTLPHIVAYQYFAIHVSRKGIVPALGMAPGN